jgi:transformation/transcription domain-associated protein
VVINSWVENRKLFIMAVCTVIETFNDTALLRMILEMVSGWVYGNESFPTQKEKATIMAKLRELENKKDSSLFESYLELVIRIFSDPGFLRTEISVKLETSFLLGTRHKNPRIRRQFSSILKGSIGGSVSSRLNYVFGVQNWEPLAGEFWLCQALELVLGSVCGGRSVHESAGVYRLEAVTKMFDKLEGGAGKDNVDDRLSELIGGHREFLNGLKEIKVSSLIEPVNDLIYGDHQLALNFWIGLFPVVWRSLGNVERHDVTKSLILMLANDYHVTQMYARPNVVQGILEGVRRAVPHIQLPPQLLKFLAKTFNAWHAGIEILQQMLYDMKTGDITSKYQEKVRDAALDCLSDLFSSLDEDDYNAGLWRNRCHYVETNSAVSFEQSGMWAMGQLAYEQALQKARTGVLPFTEAEYDLWEEHWTECAMRLQQWDILSELSKNEGNCDVMAECAWRNVDWGAEKDMISQILSGVGEGNPRKRVFEVFQFWNRLQDPNERTQEKVLEFQRFCDNSTQLCLKYWSSLPEKVSKPHIQLFHLFQQYVEFQEAAVIQANLSTTYVLGLICD